MVKIENGDDCIACGVCADSCPNDVLAVEDMVEIANGDDCIDCGICVDECPVDVLAI
ncbi:DUF362 domain-containing protein [Xiamenia xianingshaonis]|uniref:4Fe-4S binding protein n=1 Tax=Xiamenia xianingshaonis TaxID=2682776 RepID=A0A9E6SU71_9ACTN|nr:4Fe-4S binding protein [Xiamenia xianingshaonis]NGM17878.1 4Fe-4S dicluster domain-containing protein [Eggerthellaceae bacterium zg-893]NHM14098.1 4Fe-4S dicluster domain-containing protein [Xiamenia xianingshaonis]NHM16267.1 4Fe-4S dicluster domain-containing protein [Xiamenia xianingshaonis]QTU83962.1 4Fe-4S binding protein [Xiamenia xianingshaonis]